MQLIHCYDSSKFPFVIALNYDRTKVFLLNPSTKQRILMINVNKKHAAEQLAEINQTSTFLAASSEKQIKDFTDLQEIIVHFKFNSLNKDATDLTMHYCQLRLSREALQILAETKGQFANNFFEAFRDIKLRDDKLHEKDAIIRDKEAILLEKDAKLLEN